VARSTDQSGQASVELVAVIPALLLVALIAVQLALTGYALWSAAAAARAGARADYVGGDGREVARAALPRELRHGARVESGEGLVVKVPVPAPAGLSGLWVEGRSALNPAPGGGGG
jgi:hypothetical protein